MKRPPVSQKAKERVLSLPSALTPADKLIQLLIQKGVLSEEEGHELYQP
jgi:hypothetical protein